MKRLSNKTKIIIVLVVILLLSGGAVYYFKQKAAKEKEAEDKSAEEQPKEPATMATKMVDIQQQKADKTTKKQLEVVGTKDKPLTK